MCNYVDVKTFVIGIGVHFFILSSAVCILLFKRAKN